MFWSPKLDYSVVPVWARPATMDDPDAFDVLHQSARVTILKRPDMAEQVLLTRCGQVVRLTLVSGTLLNGPVRLAMDLSAFASMDRRLDTVRRLLAFKERSLDLINRAPRGRLDRRLLILRTLDALAIDPSYRGVATVLFGTEHVAREWNGRSDFLKSRIRRLVAQATHMAIGGYRDMMDTGT